MNSTNDPCLPSDTDEPSRHVDLGLPIDSDNSTLLDDPCLPMEPSTSANHEDLDTTMDPEPAMPITALSRCINCGVDVAERRKHSLNLLEVQNGSRKIYFVYILYENNAVGRQAIKQYCCNCIVGRRTVGCCAHVMTVIWFLSWARYQNNIYPPAQFLDHVLLTYDSD